MPIQDVTENPGKPASAMVPTSGSGAIALAAGDADGVQRAGLDLADQRDRRIDQEVEPLAEQFGQRLVAAAERHDLDLDAGEPR